MCLDLGIAPERISFGNTIKREDAIAYAYARGIRLFAFDSAAELEKLARASGPEAKVFARVLMMCEGAEWPLSRKFGCSPQMAVDLLVRARALGLIPYGMSFHVGSQQTKLSSWDEALAAVARAYHTLRTEHGITLQLLNMGGGFPAKYSRDVPAVDRYTYAVQSAIDSHFGSEFGGEFIVEPGRSIVGDAGIIDTEVLLVANKTYDPTDRTWVFLDIGRFGGLPETQDEAIKYRFQVPYERSRTDLMTVVLAGPTCDSADILYERARYRLPRDLQAGDRVSVLSTGAYTLTYSGIGFNGFAPLYCVCI